MLLMTFLNILFFFVSIKNNLENKLNIFTNIVLSQMKIIYNKKKNETNLIFDDDNNNDKNKNSINNKDIGIDVIVDNDLRSNNDNINDSINKENNEKINFESKKIDNIKNNKVLFIDIPQKELINTNIIKQGINTYKNKIIKEINFDISNTKDKMEIRSAFSRRGLKPEIFKHNQRKNYIKIYNNINANIPTNFDSISRLKLNKKDKSNNLLETINNFKRDDIKINYDDKDDKNIIENLIKKNNSDFYIFYVIKYIPFEERKNYISEYELENLSYKNALKIEDRNKSDFYFAVLREKNQIISIFLNDKDYNIQTVKISLFIFNFNLSLTINALFFDDKAIYQVNQDDLSFNLSKDIVRILYSTIISTVLCFLVELMAFTHKSIIKIRYYKDINKAKENAQKLIRILKIKIIFSFCIIIFFDILFFYYITAFCSVYSIIQTRMISDLLMSFLLSNSYSIILCMVATLIRASSLRKETTIRHILYLISWIISLI